MFMRDFIGYKGSFPKDCWPDKAKIAVNFVINYEEGSERNILDGDAQSEEYLSDWPLLTALKEKRSLSSESLFEYGSRAGIWRLLGLFDEYSLPLTIFTTGLSLERNEPLADKFKNSEYEIAGHGYRWINYADMPESQEREEIDKTIDSIEKLTNKKIYGWYTGRKSKHTRKIIIDLGLLYDSESYADDLPYWMQENGKKHLIIPYTLDTNDARYTTSPGWSNGEAFFQHLKMTFDCLYREGKTFPKMMTVALHARLSGKPGRCEAIRNFIEYITSKELVWICTREQIAKHWQKL
ncbi:MAG: hypothetical protein BGO10_00590 [Chlamydia sp. 32-24]|nr:MAG: hypothetical protein BGO10_00590 [Chlamydia sp. 32-24]